MPQPINAPFSMGYVSRREAKDLAAGEMIALRNFYYKPGDPRIWTKPGRALFGQAEAGKAVKSLYVAQFDPGGVDRILAYVDTTLWGATPGDTGAFTSIVSGLSASGARLRACTHNNIHYLCNGVDTNRVLLSDGTVRTMGLQAPSAAPTVVAGSGGTAANPTADAGGFVNGGNAYDGDDGTFASGALSAPGTVTHTWSGWAADATAGRKLQLLWWLGGLPLPGDTDRTGGGGGGGTSGGFNVTVKLEKTEDGGTTWTTLLETTLTGSPSGVQSVQSSLTADSDQLEFRATMTYNTGTSSASLQVYTVKTQIGGDGPNFDTLVGFYYAVCAFNQNSGTYGPISPVSALLTMLQQNSATVTRPTISDPAATHWVVYRTPDGQPATSAYLGYLTMISIDETEFVDGFSVDKDTQARPTVRVQTTQGTLPDGTVGTINVPFDTPPPTLRSIVAFGGGLSGLLADDLRTWGWSERGAPESWPETNRESRFPLPGNAKLVEQIPVGGTLLFLADNAVVTVDGLPAISGDQIQVPAMNVMSGAPGCVGADACCSFAIGSSPFGAWVATDGIYVTSGVSPQLLTEDLDWENEVNVDTLSASVLRWDTKNQILWFLFDSDGDGVPDREMPLHMALSQRKDRGNYAIPKLGQPSPKKSSDMVVALVNGVRKRYSAHPSNGSVYLEESGTADAAEATQTSALARTGLFESEGETTEFHVTRLRHTDFGAGVQGTVRTIIGIDSVNETYVIEDTKVALNAERETEQFVECAGEWVQFEVELANGLTGALAGCSCRFTAQGEAGQVGTL